MSASKRVRRSEIAAAADPIRMSSAGMELSSSPPHSSFQRNLFGAEQEIDYGGGSDIHSTPGTLFPCTTQQNPFYLSPVPESPKDAIVDEDPNHVEFSTPPSTTKKKMVASSARYDRSGVPAKFTDEDENRHRLERSFPALPTLLNTTRKKGKVLDEISPNDVAFEFDTALKSNNQKYDELHQLHTVASHTDNNDRVSQPQSVMKKKKKRIQFVSHEVPASSNATEVSRFNTDFDLVSTLGSGSFGMVYKCSSRLDGCMYAIKAAKSECRSKVDRDRMLKEVYALAALSDLPDPATIHIVRYHQAWMEGNRLYIQTELCSSNLLQELTSSSAAFNDTRCFKLLREILLALKLVHENGMVHLDIKPENIFLKNNQFKLGDFGLANQATTKDEIEEGDSRYISRELLVGDHTDLTKSDIFSLGITMYEICIGRSLPASGQEWHNLRNGNLEPLPNSNTELIRIIQDMTRSSYVSRPSAGYLLETNKQLMSQEQKLLIIERNKVAEANMALNVQHQRLMRQIQPAPTKRGLKRFNTWSIGE